MSECEIREDVRWCREVLSELAVFYAACTYQTRKRAGVKLDMTGQNVGRSLARLESSLKHVLNGGFLLHPDAERSVVPTDAGRALLRYCDNLLAARRVLLGELAALQSGFKLRVAVTHYAWTAYGQELEKAYQEARPGGTLDHGGTLWEQDRVWEEVESQVLEGAADVGIYSFPPSRKKQFPAGLACVDWLEEEYVLVLSKDLARRVKADHVSIYELSQLLPMLPKVVHYRRELDFDRTDLIEDYLRRQRVLPRFNGDWLTGVSTIAEMKESLLQGGAISFLPWPTVAKEHQKGALKAFSLGPGMRPRSIKLISRRHNGRESVLAFLKAARTIGGSRRFTR